jgi:hypothetical protein
VTGGSDPLAPYHDRLNTLVVEALRDMTNEVREVRREMASATEQQRSYQRITMDNAQRIIALERANITTRLLQGFRIAADMFIGGAILYVGGVLQGIARTLVEVLAR